MKLNLLITLTILFYFSKQITSKSIIIANYHNVLLFFPKEFGGNDDIRVIFDVRNVTIGTFKYMPVIVDVAYDSFLNHAYCYMESAITSYIMLLKWNGGRWCYQVLFEFPASQFSKYMYHSIILVDNFIYWSTDRYIMSGRLPGYEKRLLLQPSWNRLYSMTYDKTNQVIYVAAFDYIENALFRCNLRIFSCIKILTPDFTVNYINFNTFTNTLYVSSIQGKYLYRYAEDYASLIPIDTVEREVANIIFLDDVYAIYTNQQWITISTNINMPNSTRRANAKLIDPYALQYIFTFNQVVNFDSYPYPYYFSDYHDLLYRNSLYLFYFYICGMDYVENDHVFLPQMDLNNQFLRIDNCQTKYFQDREAYLIPSLIAGGVAFVLVIIGIMICLWRSKMCAARTNRIRMSLRRCCFVYCCKCCRKQNEKNVKLPIETIYTTENDTSSIPAFKPQMKTFSDSSAVSSLPSSDQISATYPALRQTSIYSTSNNVTQSSNHDDMLVGVHNKAYTSPDNESYDNDPINLSDLDYSRYLSSHSSKSKIKKTNTKTYSSGIYIMRKSSKTKSSNPTLSTSSMQSTATPTISQNSSSSSNSSNLTLGDSTHSSSNSSSNTNKVKFNEYQIKHHYDQYDYQYPHSRVYDSAANTKAYAQNQYGDFLNQSTTNRTSTFSSSSSTSTSSNEIKRSVGEPPIRVSNLSRKKGRYFNRDYVSSCNVPLYGSTCNSANFLNITKAVSFNDDVKNISSDDSSGRIKI